MSCFATLPSSLLNPCHYCILAGFHVILKKPSIQRTHFFTRPCNSVSHTLYCRASAYGTVSFAREYVLTGSTTTRVAKASCKYMAGGTSLQGPHLLSTLGLPAGLCSSHCLLQLSCSSGGIPLRKGCKASEHWQGLSLANQLEGRERHTSCHTAHSRSF